MIVAIHEPTPEQIDELEQEADAELVEFMRYLCACEEEDQRFAVRRDDNGNAVAITEYGNAVLPLKRDSLLAERNVDRIVRILNGKG